MVDVVVVADGGGTKTDVAAIGMDGSVLARSRVGAFQPDSVGIPQATSELDAAVRSVLARIDEPRVALAGVYFSGLDFPFEINAFHAELDRCDWAGRLTADNDTFALMRAGTQEPTAVAVVCGTGMNCIGRAADGRVVRFAAIGEVSGDWGGGWTLGTEAIWHAARAADRRGPATELEPLVLKTLGRSCMEDVIIGFQTGELEHDRVSRLAPLIFDAAAVGDDVALRVVDRQADELVAFVTASMIRLDVVGQPLPAVFGGGVIAARHKCLLDAVDIRLRERAPGAYAVIVSAPPILGAALLAFDELGAPPEVLARVRA